MTGSYGFNPRCPTPRALTNPRPNIRHPAAGLFPSPGAIMSSRGGVSPASAMMSYPMPGNIGALSPGQAPISPCVNPVGLPVGQPAVWPAQLGANYPALYPGAPMLYAPSQCSRQDWNIISDSNKSTDRKKVSLTIIFSGWAYNVVRYI